MMKKDNPEKKQLSHLNNNKTKRVLPIFLSGLPGRIFYGELKTKTKVKPTFEVTV